MTVKQTIKRIIPIFVLKVLRKGKKRIADRRANYLQTKRFKRWFSRDDSTDKARVETRLAFDIHRLEKGLSHVDFRDGFGKGVLSEISKRMVLLEKADPRFMENPLYLQGLAVLHEYQSRHKKDGYDLSEVESLFPVRIWNAAFEYQPGAPVNAGSFVMNALSKKDNLSKGFVELAEHRYSVREYSSEPVPQELLDKVYEVSMKTPSVCNRQATRVYQITDSERVMKALKIQGGFLGYAMPPVLLLVTSDIRAFMNNGERNEPFVDGGLFSMSLLYALEAYGLAACPLNAMFNLSQDRQTRELLDIPDYEFPVMYIAVGNFPESVPVCYSTRYEPEKIVTRI